MSKKLGSLIRDGRTAAGLTQAQLAKKVKGLTASALGRAERGEAEPTEEQVREIAKELGITQKALVEAMSKKAGTSAKSGSAKSSSAKKTGTSSKTSSAKKTGTSSSSKKTGASAKSSGTSMKLSQAEKTLVELYRKADSSAKKAAVELLKGESSGSPLLDVLQDTGGSILSDLLKDQGGSALSELLGGDSGAKPGSSDALPESLLGGLLSSLIGGK